jgi:hypothetical protein
MAFEQGLHEVAVAEVEGDRGLGENGAGPGYQRGQRLLIGEGDVAGDDQCHGAAVEVDLDEYGQSGMHGRVLPGGGGPRPRGAGPGVWGEVGVVRRHRGPAGR